MEAEYRKKTPGDLLDQMIKHVLDNDEADQYDAFTYLVLDLATHLGAAWGYGHLGNRPHAWASWALQGEEEWPDTPQDSGGVPSLWRDLKIKYDMEFPESDRQD